MVTGKRRVLGMLDKRVTYTQLSWTGMEPDERNELIETQGDQGNGASLERRVALRRMSTGPHDRHGQGDHVNQIICK